MAQRTQKKDIRSIEINISWTYATKIYIEVLRNPDASPESIATARSELLRLAKFVDGEVEKEEPTGIDCHFHDCGCAECVK